VETNLPVTVDAQLKPDPHKLPAALRYAGFDQSGNVRSYLFQRVIVGEKNRLIVVTAEIPLLVKHHVRIQDGPALCLHVLLLELQSIELSQPPVSRRALTDTDILTYLAGRPQPAPSIKGKREKPPSP
jgi:hypothetical protein